MSAKPQTVTDALRLTAASLTRARIRDPRREARRLLSIVLGMAPLDVLTAPDRSVSNQEWQALRDAVARRQEGEPLSRIAGTRGFWSLDLTISPDVLDPRPETELLVEQVLAHFADCRGFPLRLLDLGTGSGCLLLALLAELPAAIGVGVDRSPAALAVAQTNAEEMSLADRAFWLASDWSEAVSGRFDAVVANPPYIPAGALATLDRSVRRYDPPAALDGGPDGLACYRQILPNLPYLLTKSGVGLVEFGHGQSHSIGRLAATAGLTCTIHKDFAGIERAATLKIENRACIAR